MSDRRLASCHDQAAIPLTRERTDGARRNRDDRGFADYARDKAGIRKRAIANGEVDAL
jgi:hypothetical protein